MPPRTIGLYALATMERDGPLHGYRLSQRIAERTSGAWRPGPGTVYPSLRALVDHGLATCRGAGRRREYRITSAGRAVLRRIRRQARGTGAAGPDLSGLWAEIAGVDDTGMFLVRRLERALEALASYAAARPRDPAVDRVLRAAKAALRRAPRRAGRPGASSARKAPV
jgi:DNA-binding PadR family transcriptional regulator